MTSPVEWVRRLVLAWLAVCVQTFMLSQVTVFYILMRVRRQRRRAPSAVPDCGSPPGTISCVMMVRNEEKGIRAALQGLASAASQPELFEVVIVDNGCTDGTIAAAKAEEPRLPFAVAYTTASGGRGPALDAGTAIARSAIVLVVHADCVVPRGFDDLIRDGLQKPGTLATVFQFALNRAELDAPLPGATVMEVTVNIRSSALQLPFGDQGIAMYKWRLRQYGGWGGAEYPLMEDFQLVQKMRLDGAAGLGHIEVLPAKLLCSPRRWVRLGVWRVNLVNQLVMLWYRSGATPRQLFDFYYGHNVDHVPWWMRLLTAPLMPRTVRQPPPKGGPKRE